MFKPHKTFPDKMLRWGFFDKRDAWNKRTPGVNLDEPKEKAPPKVKFPSAVEFTGKNCDNSVR